MVCWNWDRGNAPRKLGVLHATELLIENPADILDVVYVRAGTGLQETTRRMQFIK